MEEVKVMFGIWLLAQIFIVPSILIDSDGFANAGWRIDFVALILMLILVAALKLIGAV